MCRRLVWSIALLSLATASVVAQPGPKPGPKPPVDKVVKEIWEAAYLDGAKAGQVHTVFRELTMGERKVIEASTEMDLKLVRNRQTIRQNFSVGNHETPEGRVLTTVMRQELAKDHRILIQGRVDGNQLAVRVEFGTNPPEERMVPWDKEALGLYAQERLFRDKKPKPNTTFAFKRYEPVFNSVLKSTVEVKDFEEVSLLGGKKARLLRTETRLPKLMDFEPPAVIIWIDEQGEPVKSQTELPGLGELVTYRTTKAVATAESVAAPLRDIHLSQLLKLNIAIPRPSESREVVYRVRVKGDAKPETAFAADDRQQVEKLEGELIKVTVIGRQVPEPNEKAAETPEEFLRSNHFIRSADDKVRELAERAVGKETDPWKKALRIERWVEENLKNKNFSEAFATADRVARTLEGDCTEHAMLAAAMCRAAGVPARTALGLVYVPNERAMGYHMWMEVWINGKWYALDPTLGEGRVGADHLKIADHHWNDVQSLTPLLSVVRVLGKVQIEVLSIRHDAQSRP